MNTPSDQAAIIPPNLRDWLRRAVSDEASDLHLVPGHPPVLRLHGELRELDEPPLEGAALEQLLLGICPTRLRDQFADRTDLDASLIFDDKDGSVRFRVNIFRSGGQRGACLRVIPHAIPNFEWAEFPPELAERLASPRDGLVVFTGATGSGKTTSLAMIVDLINRQGGRRILTVEEPVEYVFPHFAHSLVTQREVGTDVPTFAEGLKYGLRQDPDVILVGEIRDRETAQMALSAAETGHLVFTTLHTRDAKGMITRLADMFPLEAQKDIRSQLALSLRCVVSQRLLPDVKRGAKRHLALEVLWNSHPIASAIRTGKMESVDTYLVTRRDEGMVSFDESVRQLYSRRKITRAVAERNVNDPTILDS